MELNNKSKRGEWTQEETSKRSN